MNFFRTFYPKCDDTSKLSATTLMITEINMRRVRYHGTFFGGDGVYEYCLNGNSSIVH